VELSERRGTATAGQGRFAAVGFQPAGGLRQCYLHHVFYIGLTGEAVTGVAVQARKIIVDEFPQRPLVSGDDPPGETPVPLELDLAGFSRLVCHSQSIEGRGRANLSLHSA